LLLLRSPILVMHPSGIVRESSVSMEVCLTCRCLSTTTLDQIRDIAAPLRLFVPNGLAITVRSFPTSLLVTFIRGSILAMIFSSCSRCSLLMTANPERLFHDCEPIHIPIQFLLWVQSIRESLVPRILYRCLWSDC
jgi:hypothetical protein